MQTVVENSKRFKIGKFDFYKYSFVKLLSMTSRQKVQTKTGERDLKTWRYFPELNEEVQEENYPMVLFGKNA